MSTLSIHPVEYLKLQLHVDSEVIGKRFLASLVTFAKKVFDFAEQSAKVAVVFLTVGLIIFAFMQLNESALVTDGFNSAITEMVVPPLRNLPTGI